MHTYFREADKWPSLNIILNIRKCLLTFVNAVPRIWRTATVILEEINEECIDVVALREEDLLVNEIFLEHPQMEVICEGV